MQINKWLRYAIFAGIFLLPFIPLIVAREMFFPFITGKNFTFRIIVELIFGGWLILMWRDARYRPQFSWIAGALIAFLGVITLADIFGENPSRSFWSNYERMEGLITYLHLFAYFVVASVMLMRERLWEWFFRTSLGASVIIAGYGILQLAGVFQIHQSGVRIDATLGNATYLAVYALFHVFLALFFLARKETSTLWRSLYGAAAVLNTFILFATATRGAMLGLIGGILLTVLLLALFERERPGLRKTAAGAFIGVLILGGAFFALRDTALVRNVPALERLSTISLREGKPRFLIWSMAFEGWKEHPILGWGQENFQLVFNKYYNPEMYSQEPWFDRAHNIFMEWLVAGGALGFLAYLGIFASLFYLLWLHPHGRRAFSIREKSILTGLIAGYMFQNIFVFDNLMSAFLFYSVLAFVHGETVRRRNEAEESEDMNAQEEWRFFAWVRHPVTERTYAPAVIIATLFVVYALNVPGIFANRAMLQGIASQEEGPAKNLEYFKKALAYDAFGQTEVREQFSEAALQVSRMPVPPELKNQFFTNSRDELMALTKEVPDDARYRLFLATLFMAYGNQDASIKSLEAAHKISSKKQRIFMLLANAYVNKGDLEKALAVAKEGFELEPRNSSMRDVYAAVAIRARKTALANELFEKYSGGGIPDNLVFINAYASIGRYGKVAELWERQIEKSPNNTQWRLSLAAAYAQLGRRADAVAQIRKIIKNLPDFKSQGEQLIRDIWAGKKP